MKYALTDHPHNDFKSNLKENSIEIGQILDGVSQKINTPTMDLYYEHGLKNQQKFTSTLSEVISKQKQIATISNTMILILFLESSLV